jgi:hypothetical protein
MCKAFQVSSLNGEPATPLLRQATSSVYMAVRVRRSQATIPSDRHRSAARSRRPLIGAAWLLEETNASGAAQADYILFGWRPVAVLNGSTLYYLHTDRLGTPQLATDSNQAVAWLASYDSFGQASVSGTVTQNLRFPGQYFDVESGWNHNGFRDYNEQRPHSSLNYRTPAEFAREMSCRKDVGSAHFENADGVSNFPTAPAAAG